MLLCSNAKLLVGQEFLTNLLSRFGKKKGTEMLRAMFYSATSGEYSLDLLKKTVEQYLKTRPKLRKKVQKAAGAV